MAFQKAVKTSAKLRLAIAGPSGSGKTYTSLAIATALGGPIAYVDTEHGSASKYADVFAFDVMEMEPPFHPRRFAEAIKEAAAGGYKVVVIDSVTHAWNGTGGMLDIVEDAAKRMKNPNSFAAWKEATPIQNALIDSIVSAPIHVIATMRSKQEYVLQDDGRGRQAPKKVGMAPQQRDGFEYEFDVFLDMDIDNNAIVSKTRCPELTGRVFNKPGKDIAAILTNWLTGAPAQERKPKPEPKAEPTTNGKPAQAPQPEPAPELPAVVASWTKPEDAYVWAVGAGAAEGGVAHAKNVFSKIVTEQFGGKFKQSNAGEVYKAFYYECLRRAADAEQEAAAAHDDDEVGNLFESVPEMAA